MSEPLDLVTVGELLGVIAPLALRTRLEFSTSLEQSVGGAEVNVALSLARLGHHVGWCGSVGADPFGRFGLRVLTGAGVDVSRVMVSTSAPTGIYFKDPLPSGGLRTHSYRRSTAASDLTLSDVDVDYVLSGRVVHLTGITALISHAGFDLVSGLITAARHRNIYVSFDANIRHSLARGRDPAALLGPLAREADIIFLSSSEARTIFATSDPECLQAELSNMHAQALVVHDSLAAYAITRDLVERVAARRIGVVDATGRGTQSSRATSRAGSRVCGSASVSCGRSTVPPKPSPPTATALSAWTERGWPPWVRMRDVSAQACVCRSTRRTRATQGVRDHRGCPIADPGRCDPREPAPGRFRSQGVGDHLHHAPRF